MKTQTKTITINQERNNAYEKHRNEKDRGITKQESKTERKSERKQETKTGKSGTH